MGPSLVTGVPQAFQLHFWGLLQLKQHSKTCNFSNASTFRSGFHKPTSPAGRSSANTKALSEVHPQYFPGHGQPRRWRPSSPPAQQRWRGRLQPFLFTAIFQLPEIYCFFHRQPDFSSWILPVQGLLFAGTLFPFGMAGKSAHEMLCRGGEKQSPKRLGYHCLTVMMMVGAQP